MCTLGDGNSKKGRFWGHEAPSRGTHGALLHWEGSMRVAGAVLVPKYVVICACSISGLLFGAGDGDTVGINRTLRAQQAGREIFGGERGEKNVNPMPYSRPCLALLAPQPQIPSLPPVGNVWRGFQARGPRGMWLGLDPTGKNPPGGSWACWGNRAPGTKDNETHREGFLVNYPLFYYLLSQPLHPCPSPPVHPKPALV